MVFHKTALLGLALAGSLGVSACGSFSPRQDMANLGDSPEVCQNSTETCQAKPTANPDSLSHGDHGMDLGPADGTYDLRFIDAMVMHHEGAITMAEAALAQSERAEIRQLAEAIIAAQATEIAQMQAWRQTWYADASPEPVMYHAAMGHDMAMDKAMAAAMRMDQDLGAADEEFDLRFINAMVPHHEGALIMAADLQAMSDRPEMQALATEIIAAQQTEIDQMKAWRQAWYGQ
jgi:uncharacterized protein (DUF305 family)